MIKLKFEIKQPVASVWLALTDADIIKNWSGAPTEMTDQQGAAFSLWDGDVWGVNTAVEEPTRLEQDWYANDWKNPSKVIIELEELDSHTTRVYLQHGGVPDAEEDEFEAGWDEYYFSPIKKLLESTE